MKKPTKDFKKSRERHQNPYEEEKTKSENMVANNIRISQKMKSKSQLSTEMQKKCYKHLKTAFSNAKISFLKKV